MKYVLNIKINMGYGWNMDFTFRLLEILIICVEL